jgi:maleylacetate reductase
VAGIYPKAVMHVPLEIARATRDEARRLDADRAVAIGGGSTIRLRNAIALAFGPPIIAVQPRKPARRCRSTVSRRAG